MQVKQIALARALAMLNAAGCRYCVIEQDGTTHGTLEVVTAPTNRRAPGPFPRWAMRSHYLPYVTKVEVGGDVLIPYGTFAVTEEQKAALRGAISSWCSAKWGNQSYMTHLSDKGVELIRISSTPAVKASYFFGRSYWGESTFQVPHERWPKSQAYFCSTCGDVWARVVVDQNPFEVIPRPCHRHPKRFMSEWSSVPGSILPYAVGKDWVSTMDWAVAFEHLPPALQQAELGLFYRYFTKESEIQDGNSQE